MEQYFLQKSANICSRIRNIGEQGTNIFAGEKKSSYLDVDHVDSLQVCNFASVFANKLLGDGYFNMKVANICIDLF